MRAKQGAETLREALDHEQDEEARQRREGALQKAKAQLGGRYCLSRPAKRLAPTSKPAHDIRSTIDRVRREQKAIDKAAKPKKDAARRPELKVARG